MISNFKINSDSKTDKLISLRKKKVHTILLKQYFKTQNSLPKINKAYLDTEDDIDAYIVAF